MTNNKFARARSGCRALAGSLSFGALALVTAPGFADEPRGGTTVTRVCQLQGEVGPVAADHPAASFAGLPVTSHVIWVSIVDEQGNLVDACAGGEISLNVGGTLRVSPISDEVCTLEPAPHGTTGRVEINYPNSPFSPTLFAYSIPADLGLATLTGLDELVIAGTCYVVAREPVE